MGAARYYRGLAARREVDQLLPGTDSGSKSSSSFSSSIAYDDTFSLQGRSGTSSGVGRLPVPKAWVSRARHRRPRPSRVDWMCTGAQPVAMWTLLWLALVVGLILGRRVHPPRARPAPPPRAPGRGRAAAGRVRGRVPRPGPRRLLLAGSTSPCSCSSSGRSRCASLPSWSSGNARSSPCSASTCSIPARPHRHQLVFEVARTGVEPGCAPARAVGEILQRSK